MHYNPGVERQSLQKSNIPHVQRAATSVKFSYDFSFTMSEGFM